MLDTDINPCHTPSRSSHRGLAHDGDRGGKEPRIVGWGNVLHSTGLPVGPPPRLNWRGWYTSSAVGWCRKPGDGAFHIGALARQTRVGFSLSSLAAAEREQQQKP